MTTETKTTTTKTDAIEAYNTFVSEHGSDISTMTPELQTTFSKLLRSKIAAEKKAEPKEPSKRSAKVELDKKEYLELCEENFIHPSDKFEGWEVSNKPGAKDKETGVTPIVQYIIGVKFREVPDGDLSKIVTMVSPKDYSETVVKDKKILAARILAHV